jgi:hypothetical protein
MLKMSTTFRTQERIYYFGMELVLISFLYRRLRRLLVCLLSGTHCRTFKTNRPKLFNAIINCRPWIKGDFEDVNMSQQLKWTQIWKCLYKNSQSIKFQPYNVLTYLKWNCLREGGFTCCVRCNKYSKYHPCTWLHVRTRSSTTDVPRIPVCCILYAFHDLFTGAKMFA